MEGAGCGVTLALLDYVLVLVYAVVVFDLHEVELDLHLFDEEPTFSIFSAK